MLITVIASGVQLTAEFEKVTLYEICPLALYYTMEISSKVTNFI